MSQGSWADVQDIMKDKGSYMLWHEIRRVLASLRGTDYMMVRLFSHTGRRKAEMRLLRPIDITIDSLNVWWNIAKKRRKDGKKPRVALPLDPLTYDQLKQYVKEIGIYPEQYVFNTGDPNTPMSLRTFQRRITKIGAAYKLRTVSGKFAYPHAFRHSFAIHYLQKNTHRGAEAIVQLQRLLQHSSIQTTMFYLQFVDSELADRVTKTFEDKEEFEVVV